MIIFPFPKSLTEYLNHLKKLSLIHIHKKGKADALNKHNTNKHSHTFANCYSDYKNNNIQYNQHYCFALYRFSVKNLIFCGTRTMIWKFFMLNCTDSFICFIHRIKSLIRSTLKSINLFMIIRPRVEHTSFPAFENSIHRFLCHIIQNTEYTCKKRTNKEEIKIRLCFIMTKQQTK